MLCAGQCDVHGDVEYELEEPLMSDSFERECPEGECGEWVTFSLPEGPEWGC